MRPGRKHQQDQSYLKKYERLDWVIFPLDSTRTPILKRYQDNKIETFPSRTTALDNGWDWSDPKIADAGLSCGDRECSGATDNKGVFQKHYRCSSGITAIDFDTLKDKDPSIYSNGVEAFKKLLMSEWSLTMDELDQVPTPLLKTRSGGYHLYFQYDPSVGGGTNRMIKGIDGKIPLVDVKTGPHGQITIPMGKDSKYKWIVAPWDVEPQSMSKEVKSRFIHKSDSHPTDETYRQTPKGRTPIKEAEKMIDMLNQSTIDDHKEWHTIGWSIAGEYGEKGKELWDQLCSRYSGHVKVNNDVKWESYLRRPLPVGIGLLKSRARRDNPTLYAELYPLTKLTLTEQGTELHQSLRADNINEYDIAMYFTELLKGSLYYVDRLKYWVYYIEETRLWEVTQSESIIVTLLAEKISDLFWVEEQRVQDNRKQRDELSKRKVQLQGVALLKRVLTFLTKKLNDDSIIKKLGASTELFPLANGETLNLRYNHIRPRVKEDYFSWTSSCEMGYHGHKDIQRYISALFPDEEERNYIQTLCGLLLSGQLEKHFWIFIGDTDSGKSTFLKLVATVINQQSYLKTAMIRKGRSKSAAQADPELIPLMSLRVGIFAESGEKDRFDSELLKKLTGEQSIPVRGLFQKESSLDLYVKLILACNPSDAPDFNILDKAVTRRLVYVKFSQSFEKDPEVEKLYKDQLFLNHFLAWMSKGAYDYFQTMSLPPVPPSFREQKESAVEVQDSVKAFLIEGPYRLSKSKSSRVANLNLYVAYKDFCQDYSIYPLDAAKFKQALAGHGLVTKRTKTGNFWFGIEEKPDNDEDPEDDGGD